MDQRAYHMNDNVLYISWSPGPGISVKSYYAGSLPHVEYNRRQREALQTRMVSMTSMPMRQPDFASDMIAGRKPLPRSKAFVDTLHWGETAARSYEETVEAGGKVAEVKANPIPYWEVAD